MKRILVADDDVLIAELVRAIAQPRGWQVLMAVDAMQAVMFTMRQPPPDLVVLDINMPGGTGVTALRRIKASAKTALIPVLVLTGTTEPGIEQQVRTLGAADFLAKPVDPDALGEAIGRLLA